MAKAPMRPFTPGQIIAAVPRHTEQNSPKPTPLEQQLLEQAGAAPGELPDLSGTAIAREARARIARLQAEGSDPQLVGYLPEDQKKQAASFKVPTETPISSLTPEKRKELEEALARYRQESQEAPQTLPDYAYTKPGLAEAMLAAAQTQAIRPQLPASTAVPEPGDSLEQLLVGGQVDTTPAPPPPPLPDPAVAAIQQQLERCPHCGHRLADEPVAVTTEDKQQFLVAFHTGARFRKAHSLFDGRVQVIFRGLTPFENETIFEELDTQLIAGKLVPGVSYNRRWSDFRLVASIEAIQIAGGRPLQFKPISELPAPVGEQTPLPLILRMMYSKVLTTEPLLRTVAVEFAKFQKTLEAMEARATDPDFFSGIESAA